MRSRSLAMPQRADDLAQIDRHRLAAGDGEHRLFLDLALQRVDIGVGCVMRCASALSRLASASTRIGDLLFGQPAHLGDHAREVLQIGCRRPWWCAIVHDRCPSVAGLSTHRTASSRSGR